MGITKKQETLLLIGGEYGAYAYRSRAHDLPSCAPRSGARTLTVHRTVRPCAFLPGEPEVIRWQNGAVSSLPAEAGELSHGTFHNSQARRDRSPSVGEAEGGNEENVGFEPHVGITKSRRCLLLLGGEYGAYAYRSQAHDLPSCAPQSGARTLTVHRTVRPFRVRAPSRYNKRAGKPALNWWRIRGSNP